MIPPLSPRATAQPPRTPFTLSQKITAGGISKKYAKGFLGGSRAGLPAQAARLELAFGAKMGSSGVVKFYQKRTFREIAALWGGFF